jgi:ferritin-like metal-binding protein YciE
MTNHESTLNRLLEHRKETERHERLVDDRLRELGESRTTGGDCAAIEESLLPRVTNRLREDKQCRNARDTYIIAHLKIAAYEVLERLAARLGDAETVHLARAIRHDEEKMASWITLHWDQFVDLALSEAGIEPALELI